MQEKHPMSMGFPGAVSPRHGQEGEVGTCSAVDCEYNASTHCHAPNIAIIKHETHADCGTYEPRK